MGFVIPPRSEVGYLDPEVAGEGQKIILSDGDQVSWTPPPPAPVMPDWSGIKSIKHYFNRQGHQAWPAWLYHPTEKPRIVKNQDEAAALGVCYRQATPDEMARYGLKTVWDWQDDTKWRPTPYNVVSFDPKNPGQGKVYVATPANPVVAQNALVEALLPAVAAAVVTALKANGPSAPANVDPADWNEFLEFKAWQKTQEALGSLTDAEGAKSGGLDFGGAQSALTPEQERELYEGEAEKKGIKVDGRWSLEKLKAVVDKAA